MPHIQVKQAEAVLSDSENHPEFIVALATRIAEWDQKKRSDIRWLWDRRDLLTFWLSHRKGKTITESRRAATRKLAEKLNTDERNKFHRCVRHLGRTETDMGFEFAIFDGCLKALHCSDVALMYKYFACVNAKRNDPTLAPVAFLRWAGPERTCEILAWRLSKQTSCHESNC